ncbi:metal-dependent hydrolase family protein [Elioraea tepidiphila]|uniref:metal-dependent hydrolase family protein n=1 Tax=Elioraea tepidiphila TaxID=457934 RepID=UPI0003747C5B|nr:amidohydrolase family protein [Elioraea tepidiphila]
MQAIQRRVDRDVSRRLFLGGAAALLAPFRDASAQPSSMAPAQAAPPRPLLLTNLRLFDGASGSIRQGVAIRIEGNRIAALPSAGEAPGEAQVIDCGGRLAMPGLIDAHWHATLCALPQSVAMTADVAYIHLAAAAEAERTLMRGFTTVRDAGGPAFALKRAIDEGIILGPRIYPAGAMISQTSGHGDFRLRSEVPRGTTAALSAAEMAGIAMIADGEAEVLRRVREQLMLGASQIKLMAGGGVTSPYDPLDSIQFTEAELRAGVAAAADWGTYVMTHVYTPAGIQRAIRAGAKSIEHGHLADEETVRMMAGEGVWWSLQPFLADADANVMADPASRAKQAAVARGSERAYELAQRFGVQTAWGTDILFSPANLATHGRQLAKLTQFYDPLTLLRTATGNSGALLKLSGPRNPYPHELGVIRPGAYADILIAEGDPTRSLEFLTDPAATLKLIMKDGRVHKNTMQ